MRDIRWKTPRVNRDTRPAGTREESCSSLYLGEGGRLTTVRPSCRIKFEAPVFEVRASGLHREGLTGALSISSAMLRRESLAGLRGLTLPSSCIYVHCAAGRVLDIDCVK